MEKVVELSWCNFTIESCVARIKLGSVCFYIVGVYRPPADNINNFIVALENILDNYIFKDKLVLLAGDMNINLSDIHSQSVSSYLACLNSLFFVPLIDKPTRFMFVNNVLSSSTLDHIAINKYIPHISGILNYDITDHYPTFVFFNLLNFDEKNMPKKLIKLRPYHINKENSMRDYLSTISWSNYSDTGNISLDFENFHELLNNTYCKFFPMCTKSITLKRLGKPWLSSELMNLVKLKSEYCTAYRMGLISKTANNRLKNEINKKVRNAKHEFYRNCFNRFKTNSKKTWEIIRNLTGCANKNKLQYALDGENTYLDKANMFCENRN